MRVKVSNMGSEIAESVETTSTSLAEDSLNISFEDINYTVRDGIFKTGRKTILSNLSGSFNAGEVSVVMGQSGAGKSSLLDILSGYTKPTSGHILINGKLRNEAWFRRRSCYILQDSKVQETLTIEESLAIAAELKLGKHISKAQKRKRVEEIIVSLALDAARNTRAGNLSGGQRKRLAIGLELVSDPPVMFLDEPTSGLDSSISKQIVYLLHLLARQGRTVIVTIHQPAATLLQMVDRLYMIVNGQCAYTGSVPFLLTFLSEMNLTCPPYHNPVDFLIEISVDNAHKLVQKSNNGKDTKWIATTTYETDVNIENSNLSRYDAVFLTTLPPPKEDPTNKILMAIKSTYSTSYWTQFVTLTHRTLLTKWRDPSFTIMVTVIHCAMALFVGTLFYDIGRHAHHMRDNYNFLYFSLMFLMFTAFSAVTINFPEQIPVVRREHFNRWYTAGAYYSAAIVSTLPTQTVCTMLYACIAYWMTGQPIETLRFFIFCITLLMVSYVAISVGLLNGALFNVKNGVIFGPLFVMPFTVFSGFFLRYRDAPAFLQWLFHLSFLKHGLVGLMLSIYGMKRPSLICTVDYCYYKHPRQLLLDNDMENEKISMVIVALLVIGSVFIISSYIVLKIRLKHKW